ncbi:MAG TPA: type I-U CRISPR-associated protein Csb2 [Solirubrobacteraceae bacterium]|nr:type I-U CRISPR-associated protein Csb2 [Solirubrobacteraceae bacterium]
MLAIRCQFLNGTYQAAEPGDIGRPEWPPHPARLHAALVAAGWALGNGAFPDDARAALEWLERAPEPAIECRADVPLRTAPGVYVPRNLTSAEVGDVLSAMRAGRDPARQSGRVVRSFPTSIPGDEPVWFLWDIDGSAHHGALSRLVREVQYLGSSRSPVCCDISREHPPPTLHPSQRGGTYTLRVARPGLTGALIAARGTYPPPVPAAFAAYSPLEQSEPQPTLASGPFDSMVVRALDRRFPLTILHTAALTRALREAVLAHAGDDAPAVLHGHGCNPHVAFLALANVGHTHASGQLLGVAAAIPHTASPDEQRAIVHAFEAVEKLHNVGVGGPWRLSPSAERGVRTLDPARWIRPARRWQTVTPVILDRYPKRREPEALQEAVRATLRHAMLPDPEQLDASPIPWQAAAVPAPAYTGNELPSGLRLHLDVRFPEPLRGPVLAGRGRYFGVGLFAPVPDRPTGELADA